MEKESLMYKAWEEMFTEYQTKLDENQRQCIELMKEGKEWMPTARKGAGLKIMMEAAALEMTKYVTQD